MSGIGAEGRKKEEEDRGASPTGMVEVPSLAEAKAKVMAPDGPLNDSKGANDVPVKHKFDLDYMDARGRRWQGHFACHVLTYKEKLQVGLVRANMSQGVAPNLLDVGTFNLVEMLAHLAVALDDVPKWAQGTGLEDLYDPRVVFAIYEEVDLHERRFHGSESPDSGEGDGQEPPEDDGTGASAQDWTPSPTV